MPRRPDVLATTCNGTAAQPCATNVDGLPCTRLDAYLAPVRPRLPRIEPSGSDAKRIEQDQDECAHGEQAVARYQDHREVPLGRDLVHGVESAGRADRVCWSAVHRIHRRNMVRPSAAIPSRTAHAAQASAFRLRTRYATQRVKPANSRTPRSSAVLRAVGGCAYQKIGSRSWRRPRWQRTLNPWQGDSIPPRRLAPVPQKRSRCGLAGHRAAANPGR